MTAGAVPAALRIPAAVIRIPVAALVLAGVLWMLLWAQPEPSGIWGGAIDCCGAQVIVETQAPEPETGTPPGDQTGSGAEGSAGRTSEDSAGQAPEVPDEEWILERYSRDADLDQVDRVVRELTDDGDVSLLDLMGQLMSGEITFARWLGSTGAELIFSQWDSQKHDLRGILLLALAGAMLSVLISVFEQKGQVADLGFYVVVMLMAVLLLHSFARAGAYLTEGIEKISTFVKVLMPAYMTVVAVTGHGGTAVVFHEIYMLLVFLVDWLIMGLMIPAAQVYVVLSVTNHLTGKDMFSKLAELIRKGVTWGLKTIITAAVGLQAVQALITPYADRVQTNMVTKTMASLPGVGSLLSGTAESVLAAGILVKNTMGMAGILLLIAICLPPVAALVGYMLLYQLSQAVIEPVAQKPVMKMLDSVAKGAGLYTRCLLTVLAIFVLLIAVLTASTGGTG